MPAVPVIAHDSRGRDLRRHLAVRGALPRGGGHGHGAGLPHALRRRGTAQRRADRLPARRADLGLPLSPHGPAARGALACARARPHGLRKERDAAGSRVHAAGARREPHQLDRPPRAGGHHLRRAGLGRPDRHAVHRAAPEARAAALLRQHAGGLRVRGPQGSAAAAGQPLVPLDRRRSGERPTRGSAPTRRRSRRRRSASAPSSSRSTPTSVASGTTSSRVRAASKR